MRMQVNMKSKNTNDFLFNLHIFILFEYIIYKIESQLIEKTIPVDFSLKRLVSKINKFTLIIEAAHK